VPAIGPFSADEDAEMVARVRAARPEMLFVAFGAPRQDLWIHRHLAALDVPVCMGVGGSFDMIANQVSRAPAMLQRAGGEWLHRLAQEPGRLWRRYLLDDAPVVLRMLGAGVIEGVLQRDALYETSARPIP
jgi:N-acetylglucosaminyldiphosphoundecaprenol N-acetyl-beta-D-mannosaminyltransferase